MRKISGKEEIENKYFELFPRYKRLGENLQEALKTFLKEQNVDYLDVHFRIKEFDSFGDKITRKGYERPFDEIEDICGLRIICYYLSDLQKISDLIQREFQLIESVDKADLLDSDEFGYLSLHFIVKIPPRWINAPQYRNLGSLKAEIQVRTILMHAWADVEHKLSYKKKEHVPHQFRRKLNRLSALFEIADEQFDSLRKERQDYRQKMLSEESRHNGKFDVNQELNIDSLQAFLDFYFANREKDLEKTAELLDEILSFNELNQVNISLKTIFEGYQKFNDELFLEEKEMIEERYKDDYEMDSEIMDVDELQKKYVDQIIWAQIGIIRAILNNCFDNYREHVNNRWQRR